MLVFLDIKTILLVDIINQDRSYEEITLGIYNEKMMKLNLKER